MSRPVRIGLPAVLASAILILGLASVNGLVLLSMLTTCWAVTLALLVRAGAPRAAALTFGLVLVLGLGTAYEGWLRFRSVTKEPEHVVEAEEGEGTRSERLVLRDGSVEFDVTYTLEPDGSRSVPGRPASGPALAVVGGSYAFGVGVEDDETVAARLQQALPGHRVFDDGHISYGVAEVYEQVRDVTAQRDDLDVVVYLMIQDHFRRTALPTALVRSWGRNKPRYVLHDGGELVLAGTAYESLGLAGRLNIDLMNSSKLYRKLTRKLLTWELDQETLDVCTRLLLEARAACEERGARFLLVLVPQITEPRPLLDLSGWRAALERGGIPTLDLRARLDAAAEARGEQAGDYYFSDNHPSAAWHGLVAGWVADWLEPHLRHDP